MKRTKRLLSLLLVVMYCVSMLTVPVASAEESTGIPMPTATMSKTDFPDMTFAVNLTVDELTAIQEAAYGNAKVDVVMILNKDATFVVSGTSQFFFMGGFGQMPAEELTVTAGTPVHLLTDNEGNLLEYPQLYAENGGYNTNTFGVHLSSAYLEKNPDLIVTFALRMYGEGETYTEICSQTFSNEASAEIDGKTVYFSTLKDAVNAATNGEVVTLLTDVTSDTISVDWSYTLELNGKTLTIQELGSCGGTLTIQDSVGGGKVIGTVFAQGIMDNVGCINILSGHYEGYVGYLNGSGEVNISGGTFVEDPTRCLALGYTATYENDVYVISKATEFVAEVNGNEYPTLKGAIYKANGNTIKLLKDQIYSGMEGLFLFDSDAKIDLNGMHLTAFQLSANDAVVRLTDSVGGGQLTAKWVYVQDSGNSAIPACFYIEGGIIDAQMSVAETGGTLSITGGVFTNDPSDYVADGYKVVRENGSYTVVADNGSYNPEYVAAVNGENYTTLKGAIADANGGTVKLLTDVKYSAFADFPITEASYTLELNGKTLEVLQFATKNGTVTVKDSVGGGQLIASLGVSALVPSGGRIEVLSGHVDGILSITGAPAEIVIYGGSFTSDPTEYLTDGYAADFKGNIYVVRENYEALVLNQTTVFEFPETAYDDKYFTFTPAKAGDYYFYEPMNEQDGSHGAFYFLIDELGNVHECVEVDVNGYYVAKFTLEANATYKVKCMPNGYFADFVRVVELTVSESAPEAIPEFEIFELESSKVLNLKPQTATYRFSFVPDADGIYYLVQYMPETGIPCANCYVKEGDTQIGVYVDGNYNVYYEGYELKAGKEYTIGIGLDGNYNSEQTTSVTLTAIKPTAPALALEQTKRIYLAPVEYAYFSFTPQKDGTYYLATTRADAYGGVASALVWMNYGTQNEKWVEYTSAGNISKYWEGFEMKAGTEYTIRVKLANKYEAAQAFDLTLTATCPDAATPIALEENKSVTLNPGVPAIFSFTPAQDGIYYVLTPMGENNEPVSACNIFTNYFTNSEYIQTAVYGQNNEYFWEGAELKAGVEYTIELRLLDKYTAAQNTAVTLTATKPEVSDQPSAPEEYEEFKLEETKTLTIAPSDHAVYTFTPEKDGLYYISTDISAEGYTYGAWWIAENYQTAEMEQISNVKFGISNKYWEGYELKAGVEYTIIVDLNGMLETAKTFKITLTATCPEQVIPIVLNEAKSISIAPGTAAFFTFTPAKDGTYYLVSHFDENGEINFGTSVYSGYFTHNSDMVEPLLYKYNNEYAWDIYELKAGVEYTIDLRGYSNNDAVHTVTFTLADVEPEGGREPAENVMGGEIKAEETKTITLEPNTVYLYDFSPAKDGTYYLSVPAVDWDVVAFFDVVEISEESGGSMICLDSNMNDTQLWQSYELKAGHDYFIVFFLNENVFTTAQTIDATLSETKPDLYEDGWYELDGDWYYIIDDVALVGWQEVDDVWYYFDEYGIMQTGWIETDGKWYYLNDDGSMASNCWKQDSYGWCYLGGDGAMLTNTWIEDSTGWCYIGADGYCVTGTVEIDGVEYTFDENGNLIEEAEPEQPEVPEVPEEPAVVTGWVYEDGNWYNYDAAGNKVTNGWMQDSIGWCYLGSDGAMLTNTWLEDSNGWCYIGSDGYCVTGTVEIDGIEYIFDENGNLIEEAESEQPEEEPTVTTGWVYEDGNWYYYDAAGNKVTNGWMQDSIGWCYLGNDGAMLTNTWLEDSNGWCYIGSDGYCVTGTVEIDGVAYTFDENGNWIEDAETEEPETPEVPEEEPVVTTGWVYEDGNWYYYDEAGNKVTDGWMKDFIGWCYLGSDGAMLTNTWLEDSTGWCYIGADGYCVTGTVVIDGVEYTFDENGNWIEDAETEEPEAPEVPEEEPVVTTGWVYEDGDWYYYNAAGNKHVGWLYWNGDWYYLKEDGAMATEWIELDEEWYYLGEDGKMVTEWVEVDEEWYYLEEDGVMVTGAHEIDGVTYIFNDSGVWVG